MLLKCITAGLLDANCYILCDEKTKVGAVIDIGGYNENIKREIVLSGMRELRYILCTHGHFDHTSGICELKKQFPEAKVCIGKEDVPYLSDAKLCMASQFDIEFNPCCADIELSDGDEIFLGELKIKVYSAPGHTPGGVLYALEDEKAIFTGDTLFCGSMGRTDLYGGDCFTLLRTLQIFKKFPEDFKLYCGHGESTNVGTELKSNMYIR